jgi:hypothetical protein
MHRQILLGVRLDRFGILGGRGGRGGLSGGLGGYAFGRLLPMLSGAYDGGRMLPPALSALHVGEGWTDLGDVLLHGCHLNLFLTTFLEVLGSVHRYGYPPVLSVSSFGIGSGGK